MQLLWKPKCFSMVLYSWEAFPGWSRITKGTHFT